VGVEVYSADEIARAVGVSRRDVVAAVGGAARFVSQADAVRVGRALARAQRERSAIATASRSVTLSPDAGHETKPNRLPVMISSVVHAAVIAAAMFVATIHLGPGTLFDAANAREMVHLVFTTEPGPGGGGGGGGLRQPAPPPRAMRAGAHASSSPVQVRPMPKATELPKKLRVQPLPAIVAPVVALPADPRDRAGVLEQSRSPADSHGPGQNGGAGTGSGSGAGEGNGAGIGPGSGGGIGGGPYRPGSGIDPPRLVREVKADYTDVARRRGVQGEVVMEILVRADGNVGEVRVVQGLDPGLDERAVQAVRQWRFAPAHRQGVPVEVVVEASVEFRLR
jgi:TonB family protein